MSLLEQFKLVGDMLVGDTQYYVGRISRYLNPGELRWVRVTPIQYYRYVRRFPNHPVRYINID